MNNPKHRIRPYIPNYGIEESENGLLEWDFVEKELTSSLYYWLSTTTKNGNPHAIPIWGAWYDSKFFFGGGPDTKNRKKLAHNPHIVVHTESGSKVVIVEGLVDLEQDESINNKIIAIYKEKYKMDHPAPFWKIVPNKVFAWTSENYAKSPTKWTF